MYSSGDALIDHSRYVPIHFNIPTATKKRKGLKSLKKWRARTGVPVCGFGFRETTKNSSIFFSYGVIQSSNSASWSVKQLAEWWWPIWEVQRRRWSLNARACVCVRDLSSTGSRMSPHQSSNCSLGAHSHSRTQTASAEGPLVCVGVRFPRWKITHGTGIQIHAVRRGLPPLDCQRPPLREERGDCQSARRAQIHLISKRFRLSG